MLRTADIFFLVRFIPEMQLAHRYEVIDSTRLLHRIEC